MTSTDPLHAPLLAAGMRQLTTCSQCGQIDDHPKSHILGVEGERHLDCLDVAARQMVAESSPAAAAAIDAAFSGVHGDELLEFITTADTTEGA